MPSSIRAGGYGTGLGGTLTRSCIPVLPKHVHHRPAVPVECCRGYHVLILAQRDRELGKLPVVGLIAFRALRVLADDLEPRRSHLRKHLLSKIVACRALRGLTSRAPREQWNVSQRDRDYENRRIDGLPSEHCRSDHGAIPLFCSAIQRKHLMSVAHWSARDFRQDCHEEGNSALLAFSASSIFRLVLFVIFRSVCCDGAAPNPVSQPAPTPGSISLTQPHTLIA